MPEYISLQQKATPEKTIVTIVTIHTILKHVWTCLNMSKLVQIQYDNM